MALAGCKGRNFGDISDNIPPPAHPMQQYRDTLAETCGSRHLDAMSPDQLRQETAKYYATLDVPAHSQYDKSIARACKENGAQPDCTNRGIISGAIQDGTLKKFVVQVCTPTPQ